MRTRAGRARGPVWLRIARPPASAAYEVWWNGDRRGRNRGLLGVVADDTREPDRSAAGRVSHATVIERVEAVLARLPPGRYLTMTAIATQLAVPMERVNGALYALERRGVIEKQATGVARPWGGRVHGYRLARGAAGKEDTAS